MKPEIQPHNMGFHLKERYENLKVEILPYATEFPNPEAQFAMDMMKFALCAALPDGEDSAGRQRLSDMPPAKIVERACDIAHFAFEKFRQRGWILNVPTLQEAEQMV